MNLPAIKLAGLKAKLQWSADGEWSVYIKPEECALLLEELDTPRRTGRIIHGDNTKPEESSALRVLEGKDVRAHALERDQAQAVRIWERREDKRPPRCEGHEPTWLGAERCTEHP